MTIGERIRNVRENKNYSQKELEKMAMLSEKSVSKYERGENNVPVDNLSKIADALNVSMDYLAGRVKFSTDYKKYENKYTPNTTVADLLSALLSVDNSHRKLVIEFLNVFLKLNEAEKKNNKDSKHLKY